jgi:hypothetical protein
VLLEAPIELCELLSEPFIPLFAVGFETTWNIIYLDAKDATV